MLKYKEVMDKERATSPDAKAAQLNMRNSEETQHFPSSQMQSRCRMLSKMNRQVLKKQVWRQTETRFWTCLYMLCTMSLTINKTDFVGFIRGFMGTILYFGIYILFYTLLCILLYMSLYIYSNTYLFIYILIPRVSMMFPLNLHFSCP